MRLRPRRKSVSFRTAAEAVSVPIVADAAIATGGIAEGRLLAVLILDTSQRPDIDELVRLHEYMPPGDVGCQWASLHGINDDSIALVLEFERPAELKVILEFEVRERGALVDLILRGRGFYLQPGRPGDRLKTAFERPRILVDIPDTGFDEQWD